MIRRVTKNLAAVTFVYLCGGFLAAQALADNVITRWNEQALETVRDQRLGAAGAGRLYAMVNVAIYDAVNGIDRVSKGGKDVRDFALVPSDGAPKNASREAAAAGAAHAVLSALHPESDLLEDFDNQLAADLAELGGGSKVGNGLAWGQTVGELVVSLRENDGSSPREVLPGGAEPGQFRADFTSAQYRNMTTFGIASPGPYISNGPPALDSVEYAGAVAEVQQLGDAANPNQAFEELFRFWRGGGGSARPPGEWIKIAIVVAEDQGTTDSVSDTARLFALLGMAMGDSVVAAWNSKYNFQFWRPANAIRNADTDGNPLTEQDSTWSPRNGSIGGSPEHTSGQSTFAGAGSTILAGFYGTDAIPFTFEGDDAIAGQRTFSSFSAAAAEAGHVRIFAGIHFEFSNQAGQVAGRGVATEIQSTRLLPSEPAA